MTFSISQDLSDTKPVPLGMGKLVETYPLNRHSRRYEQAAAGFIFFLLLGLVLLAGGFYFTYSSVAQYGPSIAWKLIQWPFFLSIFALLIGLVNLARFQAFRRQSLEVYAAGFIIRNQKKYTSWRWGDVAAVQEKLSRQSVGIVKGPVRRSYQLTGPQHPALFLDDRFARIDQFIGQVQQAIFPGHYQQAAQAYNQGETLLFGPIAINKTGIKIKQKGYAWDAVGPGQVRDGYLIFPLQASNLQGKQAPGGVARTPVEQIPNIDVLVAILKNVPKWQAA